MQKTLEQRTIRKFLALALVCVPACAGNPYAKYYNGDANARLRPGYLASEKPLQLYSSADINRDAWDLLRRGYVVVGQSSFNANARGANIAQARAHGATIGAQLVLVTSRYSGTVSGVSPLIMPQNSSTTSTVVATAVGAGGISAVNGIVTSTSTGTQTVLVPYQVERADFAAIYFARVKARLGLFVIPISDSVRARLQTNAGVYVKAVVEASPAFNAEILPNDILLQMGSDRVSSPEGFVELIEKYQGQSVTLLLNRSGRDLSKTLVILSIPK